MDKKKRIYLAAQAKKRRAEARRRQEEAEKAKVARWMASATRKIGEPYRDEHSSDLARQHRHREAMREIGKLPRVRHPRVREKYRYDLLGFGLIYAVGVYADMKKPLLKRPPSPRMIKFVLALQYRVLHGGLKHIRWPRGKGKSTWVKIAIMWAILYGHLYFSVVVEKTKGMAQIVVEEIWKRIRVSPRILADFPEFGVAMNDVALTPQRMRVQTYRGVPTNMKMDVSRFWYYKFPTLKGHPNTGAILAFRGADQALRGINIESARPNFFFIDDPQTDEDAKNPNTVKKIEDNINGAVLGSGEIDEVISAVMASTPIEPDDVSETFADPQKHPEWNTDTETLVAHWGPVKPMSEYLALLATDENAAKKFYVEHKDEIEDGVEMMDDGDFSPEAGEVSAYQHALWLRHSMKERFFSEYQMLPTRMQGIYKINPKMVSERINGHPEGEVPHQCDQGILCYCDVNANAGLCWDIGTFGKGRIVADLAYGRYPAEGVRLYPEGIPESAVPVYVANAVREVAKVVMSVEFRDELGNPVPVSGICFDGGWQTEAVATVVAELRALGIDASWSKGFSSKEYSRYHHEKAAVTKGLKAAEECHTWISPNGKFLAINADYWKEVSQTSYLGMPLSPGSSSFWGSSPDLHRKFAQEICNEELKFKERSTKYGTVYGWRKEAHKPNHFGDAHAGLMAYGSIRGAFDAIAKAVGAEELAAMARLKKKPRVSRYVYED